MPIGRFHVAGHWRLNEGGYKEWGRGSNYTKEHILVAEKALGRKLPAGAVVHHVDENKTNNANTNLVICPSTAYHTLIHQRMRAFAACGDANKVRCKRCKQYESPTALRHYVYGNKNFYSHAACDAEYQRAYMARKKARGSN